MYKTIKDKVALITGGASGIGRATAILLDEHGAKVVITDINEPPERKENITYLQHNISEEQSWENVVEKTLKLFRRIDIIINSAGINGAAFNEPQDPEHITIAQFRRVMNVNAEGTLLGCKHGIRVMKASGGVIVNIGSIAALLTMPGSLDYACSKTVIRYLTKAVALYCADKGYKIRCNSVTPGAIYTPLWDKLFAAGKDRNDQANAVRENIPLKIWGTPEDVAQAVLYLVSDEARFVTGADIVVDGGQVVKGQPTIKR